MNKLPTLEDLNSIRELLSTLDSTPIVNSKALVDLDNCNTFEGLLQYGCNILEVAGDYLFNRIRELKELCDNEDEELSLHSLRGVLQFLILLNREVPNPSSITVNGDGLLHLEWEYYRDNYVLLEFNEDHSVHYLSSKVVHNTGTVCLHPLPNVSRIEA